MFLIKAAKVWHPKLHVLMMPDAEHLSIMPLCHTSPISMAGHTQPLRPGGTWSAQIPCCSRAVTCTSLCQLAPSLRTLGVTCCHPNVVPCLLHSRCAGNLMHAMILVTSVNVSWAGAYAWLWGSAVCCRALLAAAAIDMCCVMQGLSTPDVAVPYDGVQLCPHDDWPRDRPLLITHPI